MPKSFPKLLAPIELSSLLDSGQVRVIDTRPANAFAKSHIRSAINLRSIFAYLPTDENGGLAGMAQSFAQELTNAGIDRDDSLVIYEDDWSAGYGQSCRGHAILRFLGHKNVAVLHGGLPAWRRAGYPLSEATTPLASVHNQYRLTLNTADLAERHDVEAALASNIAVLVDCRDEEEWNGKSSSPYGPDFCPRSGRIPGARWLEWRRLLQEINGVWQFRLPSAILKECADVALTRHTEIILYCFKGSRAANTQLALWGAGFTHVRNYLAGWNEWSRIPALPIDSHLLA
jgi:thiosulfate/3-mercaptopyruvate sulfurtransferase